MARDVSQSIDKSYFELSLTGHGMGMVYISGREFNYSGAVSGKGKISWSSFVLFCMHGFRKQFASQ